tara:strand:- start:242 stop:478 length:237 start_codon:yes stop_codon:yes gene_type:complete
MASTVSITVPVTTNEGEKIVPIEAKISDGTITQKGKEYHLVQHSGSGFRYLADAKAVSNLESSDMNESMDALAAEEGF